jgi:Protein of unknown function (DUF3072)
VSNIHPGDAQRDPSKPTEEWVTGDEPMTGPQRSYLATLAREACEEVPDDLTKAQASDAARANQSTSAGPGGQPRNDSVASAAG